MHLLKVVVIVLIILLVLWIIKESREGFGQDASIRVAAGWLAGPNYGFDPVQDYADQIEEQRRNARQGERENFSSGCNSCKSTDEF